jgi:hypothetical protein
MKGSKVIVVEQYDSKTGLTTHTFVAAPKGVEAAEEWITRNRPRIPPPQEIGMVMPVVVVYVTVDGDLDAPATDRIEVYNEIDSHGTIAIPQEDIDQFTGIVRKWGQPRVG